MVQNNRNSFSLNEVRSSEEKERCRASHKESARAALFACYAVDDCNMLVSGSTWQGARWNSLVRGEAVRLYKRRWKRMKRPSANCQTQVVDVLPGTADDLKQSSSILSRQHQTSGSSTAILKRRDSFDTPLVSRAEMKETGSGCA